jgi:hypothetical protein
MRIYWPCTCPRILPSFVASQVRKKFHNMFSFGVVHYMLNMFSKPTRLAHLGSLESIFIHCNIFWLSFTLNTSFFLTSFSTCFSEGVLPFHFIMVFVSNFGHWRIMLETSLSSKSSWRNSSPLLTSYYNFFSSTSLDVGIGHDCSSTSCYNSSSSIGLDARIDCNCSSTIGWGLISTSPSEYEITITYGVGFVVKVVVFLRKFNVVFNSSSNSLLICSCSKILISSIVGACEASSSTKIAPVNWIYFTLSFSICSLLKASTFLSTFFFLASHLSLSKVLSLMAPIKMKK